MITKIIAQNLKGLSFEQEIGKYTFFSGPMGAGKSARLQALNLAILGYLPQDQKKRPGDIFATHSFDGNDFSVGFETERGVTFGRKFMLDKKTGLVSTAVFGDRKKVDTKSIEKVLADIGAPAICDLSVFTGLSDKKKVDYIFELYPPEGDIGKITQEIEELKEKENRIAADLRSAKGVIERLVKEKSAIVVPAGTLAEVQQTITQQEKELAKAQSDLNEILTKEREDAAKAKAEKDTEERIERETEENRKKADTEVGGNGSIGIKETDKAADVRGIITPTDLSDLAQAAGAPVFMNGSTGVKMEPVEGNMLTNYSENYEEEISDLEKILKTMNSTGCEHCAASIIIKVLLAKYKRREAA